MTTHFDPATRGTDRLSDWDAAAPFEPWLASAEDLVELWTSAYARARVDPALVARAEAVPGEWRLLVLTEDWCLDATATVPALVRFAEAAGNVDLRLLDRDDHLDLMDEHLTDGRARSIPIAILLDGTGAERGWWGPRPADLQAWFTGDGQTLEKEDRYRELRKWYARDRGASTVREVVELIERAGGGHHVA
ncbi:thioredoxin family protein [Rubrivirga sp.]|uniref:thioredoxin family protein n=1 Tax=Rubrivirga sp. TaxID=1885344 RepID=UPI003B5248CA